MKIVSHTTKAPEKRARLIEGVNKLLPDCQLVFIEDDGEVKTQLKGAEIFLTYRFEKDWWGGETSSLKWIHIGGAGINHILFPELINSKVMVTNSRGIHNQTMAEYALAVMLYFSQRLNLAEDFRNHRIWKQVKEPMTRTSFTLRGMNLGIVGAGEIGGAVGRMGKKMGMKVFGIIRTKRAKPVWADFWGTGNDLHKLLEWSDFIILTLPYTRDTSGLIGAKEFSQMQPGSYLINISRGGIVNEEALITALNEGKIAGACLDVFSQEPLPHDSPLFKTKNLLITPHIAGNYPQYTEDVINLFLDNLKRYLQGDRLRNRINLKRGY